MKVARAVGLDLGGTKILAALVEPSGHVVRHEGIATNAADGLGLVLERIEGLLQSQLDGPDAEGIRAIGICTPGPVDTRNGVVVSPPNLPGWENVPLRQLVEEKFGLPTTLEKDVNAAALAELRCGAGKGHEHVVYLAAGTGIGGALVVGGHIVRGTGFAGEIGHITLVADGGPPCNCGNHGCLEALASGLGIGRAADEIARRNPDSPLHALLARNGALSPGDVAATAEAGDEDSIEVIRRAGRYLGLGIASLINVMSPEIVIVGGGLVALGERYLDPAREAATQSSYVQALRPARIEITSFPETAGALGAALVALDARDG
jgi:glucokinase